MLNLFNSQSPDNTKRSDLQDSEMHDYLHPIIDQPKHNYHPKLVRTLLIIILIISFIGVVAALAVAYWPTGSNNKLVSNRPSTPTQTDSSLTAAQAIEDIQAGFSASDKAKTGLSLPIKTSGNDFYTVVADTEPMASLAANLSTDKTRSVIEQLHAVLERDKFSRQVIVDDLAQANYLANYTRNDTVCQLAVSATADTKVQQSLEVKCLDMSVYDSYAAAQRPLYNVYSPAQAGSSEIAFTNKPTITNSATANYQLAELTVGKLISGQVVTSGVRAMFYKVPSGIWYYFKDRAQTLIECEQYNTQNLKYAYAGQACRSLAKDADSKVAAPTNKQ